MCFCLNTEYFVGLRINEEMLSDSNFIKSNIHYLLVFVSPRACTFTVATLERLRLNVDRF